MLVRTLEVSHEGEETTFFEGMTEDGQAIRAIYENSNVTIYVNDEKICWMGLPSRLMFNDELKFRITEAIEEDYEDDPENPEREL